MFANLDSLPEDAVKQNLTTVKQIVSEFAPNVNVHRGIVHDVLIYYTTLFATAADERIKNAISVLNLAKLKENPDVISSALMDRIAENWRVKRKAGSRADGNIYLVLNNNSGLSIPNGQTFKINDEYFKTNRAFLAKPNVEDITKLSANERPVVKYGMDWAVNIHVRALYPGKNGNIKKGAIFEVPDIMQRSVKTIVAADDFTGGEDIENNEQLLNRLSSGIR